MFRYEHVCFESVAYALPEQVVSSVELERELRPVYERFGVHEGRLELMTGIRERRFWKEGTLPSEASTLAGRRALQAASASPSDIECLIHTSVSRDCLEPSTASIVHDHLRLPAQSILYDVSNACLGFLNGVISLANMIELRQVKRGLIVAGENSRQLVRSTIDHLCSRAATLTRREFKAAFASLTIGSGAAAAVLAHDSVSTTDHRLVGGVVRSATEHNHLCRGSQDTGFAPEATMTMNTDAENLLERGCTLAKETWTAFKKALGWANRDVARTYCHQVGAAHRDRLYASLGLDPAGDFSTFEYLGNMGSASLPVTMAMALEQDPPAQGTKMALLGVGSGLSCVMLGTRW